MHWPGNTLVQWVADPLLVILGIRHDEQQRQIIDELKGMREDLKGGLLVHGDEKDILRALPVIPIAP